MAAGKAVAARTKKACEAQKRVAEATEAAGLVPPSKKQPSVHEVPVDEAPKEDTKNVISMIQWLSIISIMVSVIGLYYKREDIKKFFN